jgi:glucoamylase
MILKAATYLMEQGPVSPQERWEEASGYSPSTLAAHIAALVCAGEFARERGHESTAVYMEEYADFLESHIEPWTVTTEGSLVPGIPRHFVRIRPANAGDVCASESVDDCRLELRNQPPDTQLQYPAKEIVDAGFLEFVRYGIRQPLDPLIEDSLRVIDATLKVDTPFGKSWRRYNHDGYGQTVEGGAYRGWGYGHAWPVLTGERGHYELAAGRDVKPFITAMERFASSTKLLPEQIWSLPDVPAAHMTFGRPTGGAMPLVWAHGEYLKLIRSIADGRVFDLIEPVRERYCNNRPKKAMEIWKFNRQVRSAPTSGILRIQAAAAFRLHWSLDGWSQVNDTDSTRIDTGHEFVDLQISPDQLTPIQFTFYWTQSANWEGRNFEVSVGPTVVSTSLTAAKSTEAPSSKASNPATAAKVQERKEGVTAAK